MAGSITAAELRERYHSGGEIAIVDAREEGSFHGRHLLMASCLPLSRVELIAPNLLPRRSAPTVVCDEGEGLAEESPEPSKRLDDVEREVPERCDPARRER